MNCARWISFAGARRARNIRLPHDRHAQSSIEQFGQVKTAGQGPANLGFGDGPQLGLSLE
ncbi:hypothetical protein SBBP2_190031 [Burkholderiales bacterium]|nr:hypothetical protein SBBP2_190031 [Burkholderiales bacterium]